ncbi:hypothetical protein ASA1KI_03800 [Opitutales bacterium ASA1]|uniref:hypothetical protein n=1 Tax=Congregicoccus parvus TaxID=3081749 RepID=UPI002B2DEA5D|nr:hypothetical protein ASA1KI_03570 [Opitutales bacterium ASA1]BET65462.1 hypothetical protein ASA1KI_03800 [Opitutales bacterium ASA1]
MAKLSDSEYVALKSFLRAWLDRLPFQELLTPDVHPAAILDKMESGSPARARDGLSMAINDVMESAVDLTADEIAAIDFEFRSRGILTLSEVRLRYGRHYRAVMKRGRIKDEGEYYLIAGVLASAIDGMTEEDAGRLDRMLTEFTESQRSRG